MREGQRLVVAIGERIVARRIAAGLTQRELADKLGVSTAHVSYLEHGERGPSIQMLYKIAKVFGTTVGRLVPNRV